MTDYFDDDDRYEDHDLWDDCPDRGTPNAGDVFINAYGLSVATPCGWWQLSEEDTLKLITRLTVSLHGHLTTPWSADDPSTILSRGRAALTESCQS